jgi:ankyrin repeat protein
MKKLVQAILISLTFCNGFSFQHACAMGAPDDKTPNFLIRQFAKLSLWISKNESFFNAIGDNDLYSLRAFIAASVDVNKPSRDDDAIIPLIFATTNSKTEPTIVQLLLEKGAQPNLQLEGGATVLHHAAASLYGPYIRPDLVLKVKLLLEYGADPTIQTILGDTPLHLIAKNATIKRIKSSILGPGLTYDDTDSRDYAIAMFLIPAMIKLASQKLIAGYEHPLDLQNNDGDTALILAARNGQPQVVRLLLENVANPEIKNNQDHDVYYEAEHVLSDFEREWPKKVNEIRAEVLAALGQLAFTQSIATGTISQ